MFTPDGVSFYSLKLLGVWRYLDNVGAVNSSRFFFVLTKKLLLTNKQKDYEETIYNIPFFTPAIDGKCLCAGWILDCL